MKGAEMARIVFAIPDLNAGDMIGRNGANP